MLVSGYLAPMRRQSWIMRSPGFKRSRSYGQILSPRPEGAVTAVRETQGGTMEQKGLAEEDMSGMAWEGAALGLSGRETAYLHERWASALVARGSFISAQEHLDQALAAWASYDEPVLLARTWCLKASCSAEAGEFAAAVASLKTAQKLAEAAGDAPLVLCVMSNRAVCEVCIGDSKAAATLSRRVFAMAEAGGDPEMVLHAHCIRASSCLMAGNFVAACNEYEAAWRLMEEGQVLPPAPAFAVAMNTNFGISGKPERASAPFERALDAARGMDTSGGQSWRQPPPQQQQLTLARCLFHAGEARRQNGKLDAANALLEEAAAVVASAESSTCPVQSVPGAGEPGAGRVEGSNWAALAMEVSNARGLCALAQGAQRFCAGVPVEVAGGGGASDHTPQASAAAAAATAGERRRSSGILRGLPPSNGLRGRRRRNEEADSVAGATTAGRAAKLIATGCKAGEAGAQPMQKTLGAVLEGIAWSLAGRGSVEGASAMRRAARGLEKILDRDRRPSAISGPVKSVASGDGGRDGTLRPRVAGASEAIGPSGSAGKENSSQLQMLQLGVLSSQGSVVRGGLGMGAGFCTGAAAVGQARGKEGGGSAGAGAGVAAGRAAARAGAAGWTEAASLVKKQLTMATQVAIDSARQLSLAHAHAGAIALMSRQPAEAAERFELQLEETRKAGDVVLEALAERNLADVSEAEGDLPRALAHLRRFRSMAQRGRNAVLEADAYRRLSSVYAEIAATRPPLHGGGDGGGSGGGGGGRNDKNDKLVKGDLEGRAVEGDGESLGAENNSAISPEESSRTMLPEAEIEEREDKDLNFLKATAGGRACVFAKRYEAAVVGLEWPISGGGSTGSEWAGRELSDNRRGTSEGVASVLTEAAAAGAMAVS